MRSNVRWVIFAVLGIAAIALAAGILGSTVEVGGGGSSSSGSDGESTVGGSVVPDENNQSAQSVPFSSSGEIAPCVPAATNPGVLLGLGAVYVAVGGIIARLRTKIEALGVIVLAIYITTAVAVFLTIGCDPPELESGAADEIGIAPEDPESSEESGSGGEDEGTDSLPAVFTVLVIAGALVGVLGLIYLSSEDEMPSEVENQTVDTDHRALGRAAGRAADELESASSLDNAVYRAWAEMTDPLPVEDPDASTPAEFAGAAVDAGMPREAVDEVTELFEEVRYGGTEPTTDQEQRAVQALRQIEREHAEWGES